MKIEPPPTKSKNDDAMNKIYVELTMTDRWIVIASGIFDRELTLDEVLTILNRQMVRIFTEKDGPSLRYTLCFVMDHPVKDFSKRLKEFPVMMPTGTIAHDRLFFWAVFPRKPVESTPKLLDSQIYY